MWRPSGLETSMGLVGWIGPTMLGHKAVSLQCEVDLWHSLFANKPWASWFAPTVSRLWRGPWGTKCQGWCLGLGSATQCPSESDDSQVEKYSFIPQNGEDLLCATLCSKHQEFFRDEKEQNSLLSGSLLVEVSRDFPGLSAPETVGTEPVEACTLLLPF